MRFPNRTAAQLETVPAKRVSFSGFPVFPFSLKCPINSKIHYSISISTIRLMLPKFRIERLQ